MYKFSSHRGIVLGAVLEEVPGGELGLDDGLVPEGQSAGGAYLRAGRVVERHHAVQHAVLGTEEKADAERSPILSVKCTKWYRMVVAG